MNFACETAKGAWELYRYELLYNFQNMSAFSDTYSVLVSVVSDALRRECTLQGDDLARGGQRIARGVHLTLTRCSSRLSQMRFEEYFMAGESRRRR